MRWCAVFVAVGALCGVVSAADPIPAFRLQWSAGLAYSPMRDYAVVKIPAGDELDSRQRAGVLAGLEGRWAPSLHSFQLGLRADLIMPVGGGTATEGVKMSQNLVRVTGRVLYAFRGNLYEGPFVFAGVSSSRVFTKFEDYSIKETQSGMTAGCGYSFYGYGRTTRRWYRPAEWEMAVHRLPSSPMGTKAGGLTVEGRLCFRF